ncbi:TIM barrel protein [archaeon]|jgi:deoxyribonuclease IV|nr:TIM barrel protein [archaeon]MBT4417405.1 TIM barrel protein [archaeon]
MIKIGVAGIGNGIDTIPELVKRDIVAGEVAFVRQVYMNNQKAKEIGAVAKKLKFGLSVHAPYYINLNSVDKKIVNASMFRIAQSCERGHYLGAKNIVFHPGYLGKMSREETYENIRLRLLKLKDKVSRWKVVLCPETAGKINVFGSLDEILGLVKDVKCGFCLDFAHMKARSLGEIEFSEVVKKVRKFKHIHCHYSGIEWTDKGEKRHVLTNPKEAKELLSVLKKYKVNCTIINESPNPVNDVLMMNGILHKAFK